MSDLATFELREHVDGRWATPSITLETWLSDANEGTHLVPMRASSAESVERALATADKLHRSGAWADRSPESRARCLRSIGSELEPRSETMARLDAQASGV